MFLLNKKPIVVNFPWKHLLIEDCLPIEIADELDENWNDTWKWGGINSGYRGRIYSQPNIDNKLHFEFFLENWNRRDELVEMCDYYFEDENKNQADFYHWKYIEYFPKNEDMDKELIRKWHTDIPDKKYHFLYYLGKHVEGNGYLEMKNDLSDSPVLSYPFRHNRLLVFQNHEKAFHQFFYANGNRKTMNLTFKHRNPENDKVKKEFEEMIEVYKKTI